MPLKSLSKLIKSSDEADAVKETKRVKSPDYLGLLDITHLLEYQSHSQLTNGAAGSPNTHLISPSVAPPPSSSILRGGHMDALIVLATSANSSVIAPPPPPPTQPTSSNASHQQAHDLSSNSSHHNTLNSLSSPGNLSTSCFNHHFNSNNNNTTSYQRNNTKKNNFLFQEAFLTTYRTILDPIDLIRKLIHRYRLFAKSPPKTTTMLSEPSVSSVSSNEDKFDPVSDEKFDFDRLNASNRRRKLAFSATRNSLTLLIRVLDGLEYQSLFS